MSLEWRQTRNDNVQSVWVAGRYKLIGFARMHGGGLRRDWMLYHDGKRIGSPSRLSEGKRDAQSHFDARNEHKETTT